MKGDCDNHEAAEQMSLTEALWNSATNAAMSLVKCACSPLYCICDRNSVTQPMWWLLWWNRLPGHHCTVANNQLLYPMNCWHALLSQSSRRTKRVQSAILCRYTRRRWKNIQITRLELNADVITFGIKAGLEYKTAVFALSIRHCGLTDNAHKWLTLSTEVKATICTSALKVGMADSWGPVKMNSQ